MERYMRPDPARARYVALWTDLISRDPKEILRELLADADRGALLRETSPLFYVLEGPEREQALSRAAGFSLSDAAFGIPSRHHPR
jgi:hypothetical protein